MLVIGRGSRASSIHFWRRRRPLRVNTRGSGFKLLIRPGFCSGTVTRHRDPEYRRLFGAPPSSDSFLAPTERS